MNYTKLKPMCCGLSALLLIPALAVAQDDAPIKPAENAAAPTLSLTEARELWLAGDYDRAKDAFIALTQDDKTKIDAAVGLAQCRMSVGDYEEALQDLLLLKADQSAGWHLTIARLSQVLGKYDDALTRARAAIEQNKDLASARLLLGQLQEALGRRDEAIQAYSWFDKQMVERKQLPRDAAWITDSAQGFLRYSILTQTNVVARTKHVLNDMLQTAYDRLDRHWWPARIAAGNLLREKHNNDEEDGSLSDYLGAMKINSDLPEALVGIGEVALENWNFEEVEKQADKALKINPKFPPAIHLLAEKFIVERRYQQAIDTCEKALAINPNDLTALSISAAASACRYDQAAVERMQGRVLALNPKPARFYRTLGDALGGIRQYEASESAYRKAIEFEPTDANSNTELGMMYMQWGHEEKAQAVLDTAWSLDPFNEKTKFTLDLLDSLKKFSHYESANFIIRFNPESDPGIGEYLAGYLEEIYKPVTEDYASPLTEKTIIEIFPTHKAFSVRITGKPWIPTVGACSGRVIALASPGAGADAMGSFNLARVLKHEFTHTVTLAATHNRIPHWFTEGLAVYQEDSPRPFDWAELLADALRRNELFTLQSIDWGFMRPRKPTDRMMAYAQSEWMCEYIVERFGYDSINKMLARYRNGETQIEVFRDEFKLDLETFDHDFRIWAHKQAEGWNIDLTPPENVEELRALAAKDSENATLLGRLARAELDSENTKSAMQAARKAYELNAKERNSLEVLGTICAQIADEESSDADKRPPEDEARKYLESLRTLDPQNRAAPKLLANIAMRRQEWDNAIEYLTQLQRLCPLDPLSWRGLGGIHLERGEDDRALPQLLELARMEERDAEIATKIAKIYRKQNKLRDAQHWFRQAIYIAPLSPELHRLLGDTSMQAGDTAIALREYKMLTTLEPKVAANFEKAAAAAHKLGQLTEAREFAQRAVAIDPSSSAKSLLP